MEQTVRDLIERIAKVEQRADDLSRILDVIAPTTARVERLIVQVEHLSDDAETIRKDLKDVIVSIDNREAASTKERKDTRLALWSLAGVIITALIAAIGAVVAALVGG